MVQRWGFEDSYLKVFIIAYDHPQLDTAYYQDQIFLFS